MTDKTHKFIVAAIAIVAILWTLAGLLTLVYWSGLALWVCAAVAAVAFVWMLRVYLRPTVAAEVNPPSASR